MDVLQRFLAYAADFERTLADDDWTRLEDYFADDAVYDVRGVPALTAHLEGKTAIFNGMQKSLNGFDRVFTRRDIAPEPLQVDGDTLRLRWAVTYHRDDAPPFVLRGQSEAHYRDDRIVHLVDTFDADVAQALADWQRQTGIELNPAYT